MNCLGGDGTELYFPNNSNVSVLPTDYLDAVVEQDFSVEIRVRTNATPDVAIIGNKDWDTGLNPGFVFSFEYPSGPAWKVNVGDGVSRADANGSAGIDDGEWHTLSVTFDLDGMMRLYTDGVFVAQEDMSGVGNLNTASGLMMGADLNGAYQYNGSIAEVRVWETLLSDNAISEWACTSVDSSHPNWTNLASYWKMDDNDNYLSNSSNNNPFLDASVNGAEWQIADSTIVYDYSGTPLLVDVPVTAMTHLCIDVLPEWNLDGISWVEECINGIDSPEDSELHVFPNPASYILYLSSSKLIENIVVYNLLGEIIHYDTPTTPQATLDVSTWQKGLYFIETKTVDGETCMSKVIIK